MPISSRKVSDSTVRRLSLYLRALEELDGEGLSTASSATLARRAGTAAAQVRKDLSLFGSFGKRGLGYPIAPLRDRLREILGLSRPWRMVLVGAGRIGAALHDYPHFRERGFEIVAILDDDPEKVGRTWNGTVIEEASRLEEVLSRADAEIVILAVPAEAAQALAERVARTGVRGILNFAPTQLELTGEVVVNNVNMAVELEALTFALGGSKGVAPGRRGRGER